MPRPKTEREKLTLRLPTPLHEALTKAADENVRSLNSEIIVRLAKSLKGAR